MMRSIQRARAESLSRRRSRAEAEVRERLERAVSEGDLPKDTEPDVLARWVMVVNNGLAVEAAGGATEKQLMDTLELAMSSWQGHRGSSPVRS